MADRDGYIILFHLTPPYKHARHCYDWAQPSTNPIKDRIVAHYTKQTRGPALIHAAINAGGKLEVGKIIHGTFADMTKLRSSGNAVRECRICKRERKLRRQAEMLPELLERSIQTQT